MEGVGFGRSESMLLPNICMLDSPEMFVVVFGQESEKALRAEEPEPSILEWLAEWLCCCGKRDGHQVPQQH